MSISQRRFLNQVDKSKKPTTLPASSELVRLAKIDATVAEDTRYTYVTQTYYGWQNSAQKTYVWRRTYRPISEGGYGAVYLEERLIEIADGVSGTNKKEVRAVKCIQKPTTKGSKQIDYGRELQAIAEFSQPQYEQYFVHSDGWYETDRNIYITMEYLKYGNLHQYVESGLPELQVQSIIYQVVKGLSYMHRLGYTHRDLKPANLLVKRKAPTWQIKIADFGLSKQIIEHCSSLRTRGGTPGFQAPEVLGLFDDDSSSDDDDDDDSGRSYTSAVDIWAVGVVAFFLLAAESPFPTYTNRPLRRYVRGKTTLPMDLLHKGTVSSAGCEMIQELMARQPASRPSAEVCLDHRWLITPRGADLPSSASTTLSIRTYVSSAASASWGSPEDVAQTVLPVRTISHTSQAGDTKSSSKATTTETTSGGPDTASSSKTIITETQFLPAFYPTRLNASLKELAGENDKIEWGRAIFSPDGCTLAAAAIFYDKENDGGMTLIALIDLSMTSGPPSTLITTETIETTEDETIAMAFSRNGHFLASLSMKGTYQRWDLRKKVEQGRTKLPLVRILNAILLPDDDLALTVTESRGPGPGFIRSCPVQLWDLAKTALIWTLDWRNYILQTLRLSPNRRMLLCGHYGCPSHNHEMPVWVLKPEIRDGTDDGVYDRPTRFLRGDPTPAFSKDGQFLMGELIGEGLCVLDTTTWSIYRRMKEAVVKEFFWVAFSPVADVLAAADYDHVNFWDISTGNLIQRMEHTCSILRELNFSPDGTVIICGLWESRPAMFYCWKRHKKCALSCTGSSYNKRPHTYE